jgi:HSP20 family molecular chaperone IbpA
MPEDANANAITATYQQGVLTITVPKTETPQAKEIPVKVN